MWIWGQFRICPIVGPLPAQLGHRSRPLPAHSQLCNGCAVRAAPSSSTSPVGHCFVRAAVGASACSAGPVYAHTRLGGACHPPREAVGKEEGCGRAILSPPPWVARSARRGGAAPRLGQPPLAYDGGDGCSPVPEKEC